MASDCPILLFDAAPNDKPAMQKFLDANRREYGGTKWFARVEQAMSEDDLVRAWDLSAAAMMRTVSRAGIGALTPEQRAIVKSLSFAQITGRSRKLNQHSEIIDAPPITRRNRGRGVTVGFGGILQPPPVRRPLRPGQTDMTLARLITKALLKETLPEGIVLGKANRESQARLFSQVAERAILGLNVRAAKKITGLDGVELASHMKRAVTHAARTLADFSAWRAANIDNIKIVDDLMLKGGVDADDLVRLSGTKNARLKVSEETLDILNQDGWSLDKLQALMAIGKPVSRRSGVAAAISFTRGFLISQPITAARNLWTQTGRYYIGAVDQALAGAFDTLTGNPIGRGKLMFSQELFRGPRRAKDLLANNSYRPQAENLQTMFDFTTDLLNRAGTEGDVRRTLAILDEFPSEAQRFLGYAAGEAERDTNVITGTEWLDSILNNRKFRNWLTIANRAQEFPSRAVILDARFRSIIRERGGDPNFVLSPSFDSQGAISKGVVEKLDDLLGPDELSMAMAESTLTALDWTFAGQAAPGSLGKWTIDLLNKIPVFRDLAFLFPRFNLVSASRVIYDHSPAAMLEFLRQPWSLTKPGSVDELVAPAGGSIQRFLASGRLARGKRALLARREFLPEILGKSQRAELEHAQSITRLMEAKRELAVRNRMLKRAERRSAKGQPLGPEITGGLKGAQDKVTELTDTVGKMTQETQEIKARLGVLAQQEQNLRDTIEVAASIGAPNSAGDVLAKQATGLMTLTGLIMLRMSDMAEDTEWSQLRVPTPFGNTMLIDLRPFAPIASPGMLFADVFVDYFRNTDWDNVRRQMGQSDEVGAVIGPVDMFRLMQENYEGRYPAGALPLEFAEAFLSISRASGTTLSIFDLAEGYGLTPEGVTEALVGTLGQLMARLFIPFRPLKDLAGVFFEEERITRIPPDAKQTFSVDIFGETVDVPLVGPLLAPLTNIPFGHRLIPSAPMRNTEGEVIAEFEFGERISPFTGEARRTEGGAAAQVGLTVATPRLPEGVPIVGGAPVPVFGPARQVEENDISRLFKRIGMPGRSMYMERSGSVEIDNLAAIYYNEILEQAVPRVLANRRYNEVLTTPALQRDFWQGNLLPRYKEIVRAMLLRDLGLNRVEEATLSDEEKRRRSRWLRAIERLERVQPPAPARPEGETEEERFGPESPLTRGAAPLVTGPLTANGPPPPR